MLQSKLFYKTSKEFPGEARTVSHKLLLKAGFIEQLAAGIYNFLPLGFRVFKKIEQIIREEMNKIGGQEVFLAVLQPKSLWLTSGRWDKMEPPLFRVTDRHNRELALGPTHEEVITRMVRTRVNSYRDLPFALYQIQTKFRNEMRSAGGLLRVREFVMKDLYSFHSSQEDLDQYYLKVVEAYRAIFSRLGLPNTLLSEALSGSIGGSECHEFQLPNKNGEDKVLQCPKCNYAVNREGAEKVKSCPHCGGKLKEISCIELGHIFKLGTLYSEKMGAYFTLQAGERKPIVTGCYGIGLGRLMAAIVEDEKYHDERGIIWPSSLAPFGVHLIEIGEKKKKIGEFAERVYRDLQKGGIEVLYDDREDILPGEKFMESDLIGIPVRLVVSQKTGAKIEYKERKETKTELITLESLIQRLKNKLT